MGIEGRAAGAHGQAGEFLLLRDVLEAAGNVLGHGFAQVGSLAE